MYSRGIVFVPVDLYESHATDFKITPEGIRPPLNALPGLGENAAIAIMKERENGEFENIEDLRLRTGATKSVLDILADNKCFEGLPESNQVSLLEM